MDLKHRLARLEDLSQRRRPAEPPSGPASATEAAAPAVEPGRERARDLLGLEPRPGPAGTAWRRDHAPDPAVPPPPRLDALAAVLPHASALAAADLLFLDVETTGLAGGTGSLAFLIGLGWWQEEGFAVRQLFLPGPGLEGPLLAELAAAVAGRRAVVTFNGNAFDLPLLRTRCLLARRPVPWLELESWDLLPASRRLWGRRLPDCRQQTLEEAVCGLAREAGDIEGWRIPQVYFSYLREGEAGLLPNVLLHNRRDVVGMAVLLERILARAEELPSPPGAGLPWPDAWANGRLCAARRWPEPAAGWLLDALEGWRRSACGPEGGPAAAVEALHRDAVRALKRARRWPDLERVLACGLAALGDRPWVHREAAILYEHRLGRPADALAHARLAQEPRRLARLERKVGA